MTVEQVKAEVQLLTLENIRSFPGRSKTEDFYTMWQRFGPQAARDIMILPSGTVSALSPPSISMETPEPPVVLMYRRPVVKSTKSYRRYGYILIRLERIEQRLKELG